MPAETGYLLDTNVVSELRKARPDPAVLAWHEAHRHAPAYLSTLTVGEIRAGIERLRPKAADRAVALEQWLDTLVTGYGDRILPVSVEVAQQWGRLNVPTHRPPAVDGLLAATAIVHRLTLATRNVADVAATGVALANPFERT
ncbi:twitching motility protein PilT [Micromonospora qiuiae]|uniref:Ribonuclease VapC n=1 Tax=Micromonospora qiuiae TaxID=502268 RepID=A0ABQ4JIQ4_9ACTN|nr:type II toxin-antitoxin system VapC family toxin [Micromonospora qiuiae]GIJ29427.1 twitching motility protein PilT [Micromonospora qiuiae]